MAVVNKFNVNKQPVTLDPDIIENMSANDVSYNSSFQYDDNTVGDKLLELESKVSYDVTSNNDGATFDSLSTLLSSENLSTLIPTSVRRGGMSICFVQSSDNKYVQYRLMNTSFSTTLSDWQGVDDEPIAGSKNLIKSSGVDKALYDISYKVPITSWRDVKLLDINYYLTKDGGKVSNPSWSISDFIRVSEGNTFNYKLTGFTNLVYLYAFYDESKKYITNTSHIGNSSTEVGSITIPSGVSFIRFCGKFNTNNTDNYDSNGKAVIIKDITQEVTEINSNISSLNEKLGKVDEMVTDVESLNNTFIKSVNLFDKNNVDTYAEYGTQYRISAYIEVTPNIVYTVIGAYGYEIFQYSEDKTYLRKIRISNDSQIENIFLDDVKYIRIILNESNLDYMFFYEGICKGAYVPYGSFVEIPDQEDKQFDRVTEYNNLWNPNEYSENASLSYESGIVVGAANSYVSPYISVNTGDTYLLLKYKNYIVCSYNANKEFVRCISRTGDEHNITIQEGEIYVRISGVYNEVDNPDVPAMIFIKKN